jgi:large subunit ribosomal protein L34e
MKTPHKTKSRTFRRVKVTTPGGKRVTHYKRRRPEAAHCPCGETLKGVPRLLPIAMQALAKTKKRPERPFGGVLCSKCMRKKIIAKFRGTSNV